MSRFEKYLTFAVVVISIGFYVMSFFRLSRVSESNRFSFKLPAVRIIQVSLKDTIPSAYMYVWGAEPTISVSESMLNQGKTNTVFMYKEIDGRSSLCMVGNENYRWELYGVAYTDGVPFAVFYNPAIKRIKITKTGDKLDKGVTVEKIMQNTVVVECCKKSIELPVFNLKFGGKK